MGDFIKIHIDIDWFCSVAIGCARARMTEIGRGRIDWHRVIYITESGKAEDENDPV